MRGWMNITCYVGSIVYRNLRTLFIGSGEIALFH